MREEKDQGASSSAEKVNTMKADIWKLGCFPAQHEMTMSGDELSEHLDIGVFLAGSGAAYSGKRGTYQLLAVAWSWIHDKRLCEEDAAMTAKAFVNPGGKYAYNV